MDDRERNNPRKFKMWDTELLKTAMKQAAEIKYRLESISAEKNIPIDELKPTLISSGMLYLLVDAYIASYEALVMEDLVQLGGSKFTDTIH